jgi:C4-dicarboxylate transporter DctM subunit
MTLTLFTILLAGIAIGLPIAVCLGLASVAALFLNSTLPLGLVAQRIYVGLDSFPLLAAPLFILAGALMETGGISERITRLAYTLVGHIRGGPGMVVVAIGSVMILTMVRRGYPKAFATAVVAAAGGMGILIPPCIIMIIYGLLTNTSIAALFLGGFLPGLVMGATVLGATYWMARREGLPVEAQFSLRETGVALRRSFWALMMPAIIMGGILFGIFTVTEAAVVAVVYGFLVAMFIYRDLDWSDLPRILIDSSVTTGAVMLVVGMAAIFAWLLTSEQVPLKVAEGLSAISSNPWFFLLLVNLSYIVIGCVFEVTAALIMTVPILLPVALSYGVDPVHLGIVVTANMGIGLVTPPVGVCLYVACGISGAPIESVTRPLAPFLAVMIGTLLVITYLPEITLFLPRVFLGYVPVS